MAEIIRLGPTDEEAWQELLSAIQNADLEQLKALMLIAIKGILNRIDAADNGAEFLGQSLIKLAAQVHK